MSARPVAIPGYSYGSAALSPSPVSEEDLRGLTASLMFTDEDERYLRMAGEVVSDQVEDILDLWYGFVASHPHLVHYFTGPDGQPAGEYLEAVRRRFGQWIIDTCTRPYDRAWLDYADEIGRRHHRSGKNRTDHVDSVPHIPLRYLIAFIYPITATMRAFLANTGRTRQDVEKMHEAWFKSVVLQIALWSRPYAGEDW